MTLISKAHESCRIYYPGFVGVFADILGDQVWGASFRD
jgi:hypothetical protein